MRPSRRAYVDWLRGVAVLCMIEWHVLEAWSTTAGRDGVAWTVIRTIGGFAAPLFLFLAGIAVPFAIAAHVNRGADPSRASWLVQRRGWQVFGIAHLFRLQSFLFNPGARWSGLLKPDILNILGLGLAGTAWLVARGGTRSRIWWLVLPAVAIVALTPMAPYWWWPTRLALVHPRLEAYIRPVDNLGVFALFPWVAFVPAGAFVGLLIRDALDETLERRLHLRLVVAGAALAAAGFGLGAITSPAVAFWAKVWSLFLMQFGIMTMALSAAWLWMRVPRAAGFSEPVLLFGRTSLFVYWVHVELAYGVLSYPLHHALPLAWSLLGLALILAVMYFAAGWWAGRPTRPWIPAELRADEQLATNN